MIKHIVMWNVRGDSTEQKQEAASALKSGFESLLGQIPGMLHLEVGIDISKAAYACDVVLYTEFADHASLQAYAQHPAHLKVRADLEGVRISRHQVDYASERAGATDL